MTLPAQDDYAVIRVPASDTRAKMYEALRELQAERDDARNERDFYREALEAVVQEPNSGYETAWEALHPDG